MTHIVATTKNDLVSYLPWEKRKLSQVYTSEKGKFPGAY